MAVCFNLTLLTGNSNASLVTSVCFGGDGSQMSAEFCNLSFTVVMSFQNATLLVLIGQGYKNKSPSPSLSDWLIKRSTLNVVGCSQHPIHHIILSAVSVNEDTES